MCTLQQLGKNVYHQLLSLLVHKHKWMRLGNLHQQELLQKRKTVETVNKYKSIFVATGGGKNT